MANYDYIVPTNYLSADYFENASGRKAYAFWLVGNSGSGKSTLAKAVEKMLLEEQYWVKCLDGDNMRSTINSDLDLSVKSRIENIRRSAEISKMFLKMEQVQLIVLYHQQKKVVFRHKK